MACPDKSEDMQENLNKVIASIDPSKLIHAGKPGELSPVIPIVNYIIVQAAQKNSSDIHIEPEEKFLNVRYRIDGMLHRQFTLPPGLTTAVIACIKTMGGLDIAQKRLPQDGHIVMKAGHKDIDLRISTCPTVHGENIVLSFLDKNETVMDLASLGIGTKEMHLFREILGAPYGMLLVTGPAGSGKTTTLYSSLQAVNKEDVSIMAVEDPVEYLFPGIRQVNVNTAAGLTFGAALRSFLRQDPDVIMVGELRDKETAGLAIQAALTGHLVLSTLHTNDSISAFTRLADMGVEPFLAASSVLGVVAQRLVRKVCEKCKEPYTPLPELLKDLRLDEYIGTGVTFMKGRGCEFCGHSGYKGRFGIYEILRVSAAIQELVLKRSSADQIRNTAGKEGLITLRQAVLKNLLAGLTTAEEVFRVTLEQV
ncbi:MAG: GspE/PulE family protein [Candidatus Omnitrophota bacterium]